MADITLPSLFSAGAVLQRGQPIPIWGKADAGEAVTITLAGKEVQTKADASGNWKVNFPPLSAGGPFELTAKGKNVVVVPNVAVGEVWIASGQSNMDFRLLVKGAADSHYVVESAKEIQAANDPMLRMFTVKRKTSLEPLNNMSPLEGTWEAAAPETAGNFTAVGYYFAQKLRQTLDVPVAVIHTSWGGTPARAWTSLPALESNPVLTHYIQKRAQWLEEYPEAAKAFKVAQGQWKEAAEAAKAAGRPAPTKQRPPIGPSSHYLPGNLFNAMINPLIPYGIRGAIWYQGEADWDNADEYRTLFPAMIHDWRARWGQGDFPFFFVQLANYKEPQTQPVEQASWANLREAQMMTLSLPNTGMASAIDLADPEKPSDIHPHNKKEVGRRLALNALAKVYDQAVVSYSGPLYSGMKIEGSKVRLNFRHADGGLQPKGERLNGFAIAGKDGSFVWADAWIDGNTVVVSSEQVASPVAVRYSWATNPIGNLYNNEGLPASSFRTDTDAKE